MEEFRSVCSFSWGYHSFWNNTSGIKDKLFQENNMQGGEQVSHKVSLATKHSSEQLRRHLVCFRPFQGGWQLWLNWPEKLLSTGGHGDQTPRVGDRKLHQMSGDIRYQGWEILAKPVSWRLGSPLGGYQAKRHNQVEDQEKEGFTVTCSK